MFKEKEENLIVKLPFGFRDIFPTEAQEREVIKETIRQEFLLWGYGEVKTPVLEFTKNISSGVGKNWKDKLISFFDIDGNLVSLRADMTIPIARLTGMRIKSEQLPARFFYFANSFRQSGLSKGKPRVVSQAGIELIGSSGFESDIEVLAILINILKKLKIDNFKVGLGHIKIVEGLCDWLMLDFKTGELVKNNLI
ncbi:MAG: ATP phosphoribosyltransferase regulatory subunit, partial [Actinobacteria bacterium]|nr:ATP phosphoribosyltransferase regulatory subunit [Actinomycetota bacterium]